MSQHSSHGKTWDATRLRVLERDGWRCTYCGVPLVEGSRETTVDHVIAKANGGTDDELNLVSACRRCNGQKSDAVSRRIGGFNPNWLDQI